MDASAINRGSVGEIVGGFFDDLLSGAGLLALSAVEIAAVVGALYLAHRFFESRYKSEPNYQFRKQLILLGLSFTGLILVIVIIPIGGTLRGQLLSLLGILISAAIALSATTFVGNAMAGIMLRAVKSCRRGDYVHIGEHFGRITEMDLLHTELQTEDRDLTTLPNLYLVTKPLRVMRSSGTIISVTVSLGYDVSRRKIEPPLLEAAEAAGLQKPFVEIKKLGDFSVTYRIAGLLTELRELIAARSRLRAKTLDALHEAGIEIVSPTFMNTRPLSDDAVFIPKPTVVPAEPESESSPDKLVFDKALEAESLETIQTRLQATLAEIRDLEHALKDMPADGNRRERAEARLEDRRNFAERLSVVLKRREEKLDKKD